PAGDSLRAGTTPAGASLSARSSWSGTTVVASELDRLFAVLRSSVLMVTPRTPETTGALSCTKPASLIEKSCRSASVGATSATRSLTTSFRRLTVLRYAERTAVSKPVPPFHALQKKKVVG